MPNKCVIFRGLIIPGTEIRVINNSSRNLEVKKLLRTDKEAKLSMIKLQFKDETIGDQLMKAVQ